MWRGAVAGLIVGSCCLIAILARAGEPTHKSGDIVLKMGIDSGSINADGDERVFTIPVAVNGVDTNFVWATGGHTIITEALADRAGVKVIHSLELDQDWHDANGAPLFAGKGQANIELDYDPHFVDVWVMKDGPYTKGLNGIIGNDIARRYQFEIDPRIPQLTLRTPGTALSRKPLATLPLIDRDMQFWVNVMVRNVNVDMALMQQTPTIQAAPDLQRKWDLDSGEHRDTDSYMGEVRVKTIKGKDAVYFSKSLVERHLLVVLLADTQTARSGIGQTLLNRFDYLVDPQLKQFCIMERLGEPATQPTTQEAAGATAP